MSVWQPLIQLSELPLKYAMQQQKKTTTSIAMKTSIRDQTKSQTKWPDLLNRIQKDYSSGSFPRSEIQDLNHLEEWAAATILLENTFETLRMLLVFPHLSLHLPPPVSSAPLPQSPFEIEITINSTGQKSRWSSKSGVSHSRKWVCPDWVRIKAPTVWTVPLTPNGLVDIIALGSPANILSPEWVHDLPRLGFLSPQRNLSQWKATPFTQSVILENWQWVLIFPSLSPTSVCQFCLIIS